MKRHWKYLLAVSLMAALALAGCGIAFSDDRQPFTKLDRQIDKHAQRTLAEGRQIFRFDTFGDEAFWGDTIKLHQAIQGTRFGGVGPGVSPKNSTGSRAESGRRCASPRIDRKSEERSGRFGQSGHHARFTKVECGHRGNRVFRVERKLRSIGIQCALVPHRRGRLARAGDRSSARWVGEPGSQCRRDHQSCARFERVGPGARCQ